jgi:hypothetical protein
MKERLTLPGVLVVATLFGLPAWGETLRLGTYGNWVVERFGSASDPRCRMIAEDPSIMMEVWVGRDGRWYMMFESDRWSFRKHRGVLFYADEEDEANMEGWLYSGDHIGGYGDYDRVDAVFGHLVAENSKVLSLSDKSHRHLGSLHVGGAGKALASLRKFARSL